MQGQVALLTINRPKQHNALDSRVLRMLEQELGLLMLKAPRCLIITGAGDRAFVAGADTRELENLDEAGALEFAKAGSRVFNKIQQFSAPVLAAVNGYALGGGCELALACDVRLAAEGAVFALPETGLGILPGWGGTQRLPLLVGYGKAAEMIFTGRRINAAEALQAGLVQEVCPQEKLLPRAMELAAMIAANAPLAVQSAKAVMRQAADLKPGLQREAEAFARMFATDDGKNGIRAFNSKSAPVFEGK